MATNESGPDAASEGLASPLTGTLTAGLEPDSIAVGAAGGTTASDGISCRTAMFQRGNATTARGNTSSATTARVHTRCRDAADARFRIRPDATAATRMIAELLTSISTLKGVIAF